MLKLGGSREQIKRLTSVNSPEHEGIWDSHSTSQWMCMLSENVEVGFRDCGRTWYTPIWWAAKGNVQVAFSASYLV